MEYIRSSIKNNVIFKVTDKFIVCQKHCELWKINRAPGTLDHVLNKLNTIVTLLRDGWSQLACVPVTDSDGFLIYLVILRFYKTPFLTRFYCDSLNIAKVTSQIKPSFLEHQDCHFNNVFDSLTLFICSVKPR